MNTRRRINTKDIISGERQGYARGLVGQHRTKISDPEVRRAITRLSIINVIS